MVLPLCSNWGTVSISFMSLFGMALQKFQFEIFSKCLQYAILIAKCTTIFINKVWMRCDTIPFLCSYHRGIVNDHAHPTPFPGFPRLPISYLPKFLRRLPPPALWEVHPPNRNWCPSWLLLAFWKTGAKLVFSLTLSGVSSSVSLMLRICEPMRI